MEGKGGPKCSTHGRQDKENKRRGLFKSCLQKTQRGQTGMKKQSSNQERDKVAKIQSSNQCQSTNQTWKNCKINPKPTKQETGAGA